MRTDNIRNS